MDQSVMRSINSGLYIVERNIRNLINELEENQGTDWILKKSVNDISEKNARYLTEKANVLLNEIRQLERIYKLEQTIDSMSWRLLKSLFEIWTILSDLTPEGLKGYGTMTAEEASMLTDHVNKIMDLCNEMRNTLSNQR